MVLVEPFAYFRRRDARRQLRDAVAALATRSSTVA
jgi:hypothetical protein